MYDDVLNWFRSPFMMFLLVLIAGTLGYLHATNNMHYVTQAIKMVQFMWKNFIKEASKERIEQVEKKKE
jgi:succinate dehydrogenase hydrophobic anchor subunit